MSGGLHQLGFDVKFAPVADVWDGVHPMMAERSDGQDPATVAADVKAPIAGIHRAWLPFQAAVQAGVDIVMVGHLTVPALDPTAPSSMSPVALQVPRRDLGFGV